ncbi:hypothetical protein MRB53_007372 [Persea americana]|uniref:Uncharacterized protein n=1 Tax=Persea americana TaxID=3435 RepID=A0ACC2MIS5_PERAE|nr:hypothetical protein MRB53_007372 [Persea americana]
MHLKPLKFEVKNHGCLASRRAPELAPELAAKNTGRNTDSDGCAKFRFFGQKRAQPNAHLGFRIQAQESLNQTDCLNILLQYTVGKTGRSLGLMIM